MNFVGDEGYSPGTIRNTLGSGLKASGFFQKDGRIQNMRGGFIGAKQPYTYQVPPPAPGTGFIPQQSGYNQGIYTQGQGYYQGGYYQPQVRQLILEPAQQGIIGNGMATISAESSFLLIANLPVPQTFLAQGQMGMYACYLVDNKGKTGFLAGVLKSVGNGVYRTSFQSPVPLHNYGRVVVSVENPAQLGHAPNGPIILKVKEPMGMMTFLTPMKNTATTAWGKISGLFKSKKNPAISPGAAPIAPGAASINPGAAPISPEAVAPINPEAVPINPGTTPISPELLQSQNLPNQVK